MNQGNPNIKKTALKVLEETSRTFYIPISYLPERIKEAVAATYLCLRAIDEVEDHPTLDNSLKAKILREISFTLQTSNKDSTEADLTPNWHGAQDKLAEVTLRLPEWCLYAPKDIAPRVWDCTASMADRMAYWAERNWEIKSQKDLDAYTFSVAGAVGLILSELWEWYEGVKTNRELAIAFGRGLQATNIVRNKAEDQVRGVSFYPEGWTNEQMQNYGREQLTGAIEYVNSLPKESAAFRFCCIPLALARSTLDCLKDGKEKLSRSDVMIIIAKCVGEFSSVVVSA